MKKLLLPALMAIGFTNPAWADAEKDIVQVLASCLVEMRQTIGKSFLFTTPAMERMTKALTRCL